MQAQARETLARKREAEKKAHPHHTEDAMGHRSYDMLHEYTSKPEGYAMVTPPLQNTMLVTGEVPYMRSPAYAQDVVAGAAGPGGVPAAAASRGDVAVPKPTPTVTNAASAAAIGACR